jgi:hypothetical protein
MVGGGVDVIVVTVVSPGTNTGAELGKPDACAAQPVASTSSPIPINTLRITRATTAEPPEKLSAPLGTMTPWPRTAGAQ